LPTRLGGSSPSCRASRSSAEPPQCDDCPRRAGPPAWAQLSRRRRTPRRHAAVDSGRRSGRDPPASMPPACRVCSQASVARGHPARKEEGGEKRDRNGAVVTCVRRHHGSRRSVAPGHRLVPEDSSAVTVALRRAHRPSRRVR
jgi:hypothetical protein